MKYAELLLLESIWILLRVYDSSVYESYVYIVLFEAAGGLSYGLFRVKLCSIPFTYGHHSTRPELKVP